MKSRYGFFVFFIFFSFPAPADSLRVLIAGRLDVAQNNPAGSPVPLGFNGSALIGLEGDTRFLRGVELELSAPQLWLSHRGSLAMAVYADLDRVPAPGTADIQARRTSFEPLPNKIQMVTRSPSAPPTGCAPPPM
jgi:hypothetical protein